METVPALEQKIGPLYLEIRAIMRLHNLNVTTTFQCGKMSKPGYPGGDIPLNFFSIYLNNSDPNIPPLDPIKDDIVRLFRQQKVNAHVQVISSKLCHRPSAFFIASTHPLVIAYKRTKHNIVELLNNTIGNKWRLLCPFHVGPMRAKAQPMIVVLVEPWTCANWFELRTQIMSQISPYIEKDDFDIEFLPGGLSPLTNGGESFVDRWTDSLQTPFLEWAVRSASREITMSSPARPLNQVVRIECLARIDRDVTLARLESSLNAMREQYSEISAKVQERELIGATPHPRHLEWIANYDSHLEKSLPQRASVERMPHVLGEVEFVSGKQVRDSPVLGWAFVQLSKEAEEQCFRPNRMFTIPSAFLPHHLIPPRPLMVIQEHSVVDEFGSLKGGDYCVKNGRTTRVTAGICNGSKAYCNWESSCRYNSSGEPVDMATVVTEEFIIVTEESELDHSKRAFCVGGDAGSFILNRDGAVTGLLWGGVVYQDLGVGLASSMSDVLESIKEKVGGPVSVDLPQ